MKRRKRIATRDATPRWWAAAALVAALAVTQGNNSTCAVGVNVAAPSTCNYQYDGYGRLTSEPCNTYTYDGFDRTATDQVKPGTGCGGNAATTITSAYDGLDRQVSQADSSRSVTTAISFDGLSSQVAVETPSNGSPTVYTPGPTGQAQGLEVTSSTPTYQELTDDGFGNVGAVTSSAGGLACGELYDPFGTPQAAASSTKCSLSVTSNDVYYRAGRQDTASGSYQFGSRTYVPSGGTFTTSDGYRAGSGAANESVGTDPLTANTYVYVNGDPVNLMDPTGHRYTTGCEDGGYCYSSAAPAAMPCNIAGKCGGTGGGPGVYTAGGGFYGFTGSWYDYQGDPNLTTVQGGLLNDLELQGLGTEALYGVYQTVLNDNTEVQIDCQQHPEDCNPNIISAPGDVSPGDVAAVASLLVPGAEEYGIGKLGADVVGDLIDVGGIAERATMLGEDAGRGIGDLSEGGAGGATDDLGGAAYSHPVEDPPSAPEPPAKPAVDELSAARTGFSFFHDTSVGSGESLLGGAPLDAGTAAAEHIDGPGGFNLATDAGDAEYFALRRAPGTILQYDISEEGVAALRGAGSQLRDIPGGPPYFEGQEFNVPESAFDLFNRLMDAGHIEVSPYGG